MRNLDVPCERIAELCRKHGIRWLAVFGSALRDDFGPDSDIDLLVEFKPDRIPCSLTLPAWSRGWRYSLGAGKLTCEPLKT